MTDTVWVCETGEYEDTYTFGAWRSVEQAIRAIKDEYKAPYVVVWEEPKTIERDHTTELWGHFKQVNGYSTEHSACFWIRPMTVFDEEDS